MGGVVGNEGEMMCFHLIVAFSLSKPQDSVTNQLPLSCDDDASSP